MSLLQRLLRILSFGSAKGIVAGVSRQDFPNLTREDIARVQGVLGYRFRNRDLLVLALVHRSHIQSTGASRLQTNERLEFLGDAVLGMVTSIYLYKRFPDCQEGELTKMKSILVCGDSLARVALQHDLGRFVQMSKGEAMSGGRDRASIMADVVEALLGAIYLDGGLRPAAATIRKLVLRQAEEQLAAQDLENYKSRLQEMIQAEYKVPPRYRVVTEAGPDHDKLFEVQVSIKSRILGWGSGTSKKIAEQDAARRALENVEPPVDQEDINRETED